MTFHYGQLLGKTYQGGLYDCYGLVRAFYRGQYGIVLPNYARPLTFDHAGLDLVGRFKSQPDYTTIPTQRLEFKFGDVLIFQVASPLPNHFGVYIGNDQFIHHMYDRASDIQHLDERWWRRLIEVKRHVDVKQESTSSIWDVLPEHVRAKYGLV